MLSILKWNFFLSSLLFIFTAGVSVSHAADDNVSKCKIHDMKATYKYCKSMDLKEYKAVQCSELKDRGTTKDEDAYAKCLTNTESNLLKAMTKYEEKGPSSCEDKKTTVADFKDTTRICNKIISKETKSSRISERLATCKALYNKCVNLREKRRPSKRDLRDCEWMQLADLSKEDLKEMNEKIDDREKELLETFAQGEVDSTKAMEARQEQTEKLNDALRTLQNEIQQTISDAQSAEMELTGKEKEAYQAYINNLDEMQTQINVLQAVNLPAVHDAYIAELNAAKNLCQASAKKKYQELLAKKVSKLSKTNYQITQNKASIDIRKLTNSCLETGSEYATAAYEAAAKRTSALREINVKVDALRRKMARTNESYLNLVNNSKQAKTSTKMNAQSKISSLQNQMNTVQRELMQLQQPDQSQLVQMMQQQQANVREYQDLQDLKDKKAGAKGGALLYEDVKILAELSTISWDKTGDRGEDLAGSVRNEYYHPIVEDYLQCTKSNSFRDSKKSY